MSHIRMNSLRIQNLPPSNNWEAFFIKNKPPIIPINHYYVFILNNYSYFFQKANKCFLHKKQILAVYLSR